MCTCLPCLPCSKWHEVFKLLRAQPHLASCVALRHPQKTLLLLQGAEVDAVGELVTKVPKDNLTAAFAAMLEALPGRILQQVVAPLFGERHSHAALAVLLQILAPADLVLLLREAPKENLRLACATTAAKLAAVLRGARRERIAEALLPVIAEPDALVTGKFVRLVETAEPGRVASLINNTDVRTLLLVLRHVDAEKLTALLNGVNDQDGEPGGALHRVMEELANDSSNPPLVQAKLAPLLAGGKMDKIIPFIQQMPTVIMIRILRKNTVEALITLVEYVDLTVASKLTDSKVALRFDQMLAQRHVRHLLKQSYQ